MEKNKYFTPELEDIRVGYECEMNWDRGYNETWVPLVIGIKDRNGAYLNTIQDVLVAMDDGYGEVRVPYLTKEQIEAEGCEPGFEGFFKNGFKIFYYENDYRLIIQVHNQVIFNGKCKDINTFRWICKLLGI